MANKNNKPHEVDKDQDSAMLINGRLQQIPARPTEEFTRPTLAAGAVLWRGDITNPDSIEVAVIHRPHYDDWSLAKGKVDPGESIPTTAAREILEETGYDIRLGKLIGKVTYPVLDRTKVVYYWTAQVVGGEFVPNDEVDEIRWLSVDEACELLSYQVDTEVLAKAAKRFRTPSTTRVLYVRHAHAHGRQTWGGDDNKRPLDKKGRRQAEMLVPMLLPFKPTAIYSAMPDRCQATALPLADELGLDMSVNRLFGDDAWETDPEACKKRFTDVVAQGGVPMIVGQGDIIPEMIKWLSENGTLPIDEKIKAKKGSVWVLSFHDGVFTGADYLASSLPVK
ncbi:NUDIX hydrolase [Corynebacterium glutamicum]|uniref:NUDIX hydrolase n=1 Tax=Corynebacterium glutamicum TaxID=1718 RepID=UPI00146993FB|nr:bifunctional NUDIX hydrolase/histidine phosphatase family protein [Corynebacterium glutamicum]GFK18699.1 NTP pyrophosphohydrolase [Corynebacterium glutamicum]